MAPDPVPPALIAVGDVVTLADEWDCIVPAGDHVVAVADGELLGFGGTARVWRRRVTHINGAPCA